MMATDVEVTDKILYDLSVNSEWLQEPEKVYRQSRERSNVTLPRRITSVAQRTAWTVWRAVGFGTGSEMPCMLPPGLVKLLNSQINWHFAVTQDGRHVAVLQDQDIEVRSSFDDFASITGRVAIHARRDAHPQWRKVAWSEHGDLLACADSVGQVFLYDTMCTPVTTIHCGWSPSPSEPADLSRAVCALVFKAAKTTSLLTELWVINYQGTLKKYAVRQDGSYQLLHSFSFSSYYPQGIGAVLFHPKYELLIVGGCGDIDPDDDASDSQKYGLTAWRALSGSPHYKLVTDLEQDLQEARRKRFRMLRRLKQMTSISYWYGKEQDGVYRLALSPNGQLLATVHHSGRYTLWHVPSLKLKRTWPLDQQPGYDEVNQAVAENPKRRKMMKEHLRAFWLADTNWWSDKAVILARGTGAVTVSSSNRLNNLLGHVEWFEPAPRLSHTTGTGFLSLEVECKYQSLKRHMSDGEGSGSDDDYDDSDDDLDLDLLSRSTRYVKYSLYYVTDIERFQPPRKKPKLVTRTYRLLCLKSTTPEELYARKIDNEEYGEALMLAKSYGLDCDLVYQRQWRKTPVSVASIQDYLSKIQKRAWVMHECLERVPENVDAMKELLQYGLRGTDLEALITIGRGEDNGRFIVCDRFAAYDESIDSFHESSAAEMRKKEKEHQLKLMKDVQFDSLTLEQRELCRARTKLLQYLDRLSTYEEILGGIHVAADRYNARFFEDFRSKNIVQLAVDYARLCDWRALDTLFFYHGEHLLPHRLAILANFPETFSPQEYRELLPEVGTRAGGPDVVEVKQHCWRDTDWVEMDDVRSYVDPTVLDYGAFLYEDNPEYSRFKGDLSRAVLTEWYTQRALDIERFSRQVDHALELVRLGSERYVEGLEELHDNLVTMETLVYECHIDDSLSLSDIVAMPDIDKLRLMMMRSSEEMYVKNVKRWLVPFLNRLDRNQPGAYNALLWEYMVTMAKTDLTLCLKIFESSKSHQSHAVITSESQLVELALECIYVCEASDQLANAFGVLECLPQRGFGVVSSAMSALHNQVDALECHLSAAEILENHDVPQTIAFIRHAQQNNEETIKLLTKLTRVAGRRDPPPRAEDWRDLLKDMLTLREKGFKAVDANVCYEIFVESLLTSGRHEDISLAGKMIEASKKETEEPDYSQLENEEYGAFEKVAYVRAIELVLNAAREYFDSSANLADSNMELSRACLKLIHDSPAEISNELDLIDALSLLDGFGVRVLPLQVRMCKDRTEMVELALKAKTYTYKNSQRLLKLGHLLHIDGKTQAEKEGKVLRLVAQAALHHGDGVTAYDNCYRLVQLGYGPAWCECKALAELEDFRDIRAKVELLSFAVTHCRGDMIEPILRAKCLLQAQINYEILHEEMAGRESQSPPPKTPLSAAGAIQQTKAILSSTNKVTKTVLSHVSDRQWWRKTLKHIRPLRATNQIEARDDGNEDFSKTGCHPFYASAIGDCYENRQEVDYSAMRMPRLDTGVLSSSEGVLRTSKLEETLVEGDQFQPATEVLLQLAQDTLKEDTALGLAYLLALPKAQEADRCFENLPRTGVSLELVTYYYALQIYEHLSADKAAKAHIDPAYMHPPEEVSRRVLNLVRKGVPGDEGGELAQRFRESREKLLDFCQAHKLQELGRGVDIGRFAEDSEYKQETILGLAMSTEQAVYDIAVSLAQRYDLSLWELFMTHLEFLFESDLTVQDIEKRVTSLKILPTLREKPGEFCARLKRYVWPTLNGTDHDMLLYYYTLMDGCGQEGRDDPQTHIKLLKKVMAIASELDYKKLTDRDSNPLDVMRPVLNPSNVNQIAKMASKIPTADGSLLQASVVYCAWALKQFWEGASVTVKKGAVATPQSQADWVHRYESCHEFMNKLAAEDFVQFIDQIVFQKQSLDVLSLETRSEIVKRAVRFCKQQQSKNKANPEPWSMAATRLQNDQKHLNMMTSHFMANLHKSNDVRHKKYHRLFDLSRSQDDKVQQLLVSITLDAQPIEFVNDFLQASSLATWTVATVVKTAVHLITQSIRNPGETDKLLENKDCVETLRAIVVQVSRNIEEGADHVTLEDVMSVLRPFCADTSVEVSTRLDVLQILEQSFELDDKDLALLLLYRTDAIVTSQWPDVKLTTDEIGTDADRERFFCTLLENSGSGDQFRSLTRLVHVWPPLGALKERSKQPEKHPYCQLIQKCVLTLGKQSSSPVIDICKEITDKHEISEECVDYMFKFLVESGLVITAVKCVLLSDYPHMHTQAVDCLKPLERVDDDEELIKLLLKRHLLCNLVGTCLYQRAINHILESQAEGADETPYHLRVDNLAYQLAEDGYEAEAGSLLSRHRGLHPMLGTFDSAFSVVSRWLGKSG